MKKRTCPDCGKVLKKDEVTHKMYRDRYCDSEHPEGGLKVCGDCYIGKKATV